MLMFNAHFATAMKLTIEAIHSIKFSIYMESHYSYPFAHVF